MMVVMSALAPSQQDNPPVIPAVVRCIIRPVAPDRGCGIDQPGDVETINNTQKATQDQQHGHGHLPAIPQGL